MTGPMEVLSTIYRYQYYGQQWLASRWYNFSQLIRKPTTTKKVQAADHILIVITGLLGDSVMCTPVLIGARKLWPNANIGVLGKTSNCELLGSSPFINYCKSTPASPFSWRDKKSIRELKTWLKKQNIDIAIICLGDQFALALAEAGIPVRVGVHGTPLAPCLTHTYPIGSPRTWGPDERLNCLRTLGHDVESIPPQLWVTETTRTEAWSRLAQLGLPSGTRYAVLHPFGSTKRQWWPLSNLGRLAKELDLAFGLRSVLVGGAETSRFQLDENPRYLIDARNQLSLKELLGIVAEADLVVSTDSGPFHIAGALERPLVGLFRTQRPEHATRYRHSKIFLGNNRDCNSKCQWDHCSFDPCNQMKSISFENVLMMIDEALSPIKCKITPGIGEDHHFTS